MKPKLGPMLGRVIMQYNKTASEIIFVCFSVSGSHVRKIEVN